MKTGCTDLSPTDSVILLILSLLFVLSFSTTTSPIYAGWRFWYGGDSGVFQEMGYCIIYGKKPYIDFFDHKGPVLFAIQALGLTISRNWGILALQVLSLFVTLVYCFKTSSLFINHRAAKHAIILSALFVLFAYYQRGNTSEEWCLPFISVCVYLYLKEKCTDGDVPTWIFLMMGLSSGFIFLIRANSAAPILGFFIYDCVINLRNRRFSKLITNLALVASGAFFVVAISIISFIVLYGIEVTKEMLYATFTFNILYIHNGIENTGTIQAIKFITPLLFFVIITATSINKTSSPTCFSLILTYLISAIACGTKSFDHYVIIFIPLFVVTISISICRGRKINMLFYAVVVLVCLITAKPTINCLIARSLNRKEIPNLADEFQSFVALKTSEEKKSIYNYHGCLPVYCFVNNQMLQCSRIAFPTHLSISPKLLQNDIEHGVKEIKPEWIIVRDTSEIADYDKNFVATHYIIKDSLEDNYSKFFCLKKLHTLYSI